MQVLSVGIREGSLVVDVHAVLMAPAAQPAAQGSHMGSEQAAGSSELASACGQAAAVEQSYAAYRSGVLVCQVRLLSWPVLPFAVSACTPLTTLNLRIKNSVVNYAGEADCNCESVYSWVHHSKGCAGSGHALATA